MKGVREYGEGKSIELARRQDNGPLVIRALNEDRYNCTELDVLDLVKWLRHVPNNGVLKHEKVQKAEKAA